MKLNNLVAAVVALGLVTATSAAYAIPFLQLGIAGAAYDGGSDTSIAGANPFTLYAFLTPKQNATQAEIDALLAETYYVSMALVPQTSQPGGSFGSFTVNGTAVNVTADMVFGTPPLETIAAQSSDPGDLAPHGIFETYFKQFLFTFNSANEADPLDVQGDADLSGLNTSGSGMYFQTFAIDVSGLTAGKDIHFDLYNQEVVDCGNNPNCVAGDIDVNSFAPFSHDAQSGSSSSGDPSSTGTTIPEPSSVALVLLGLGLLGAGFAARRRA